MKATLRTLTFSDFGPFEGVHSFKFDGPGTYAICAPNGRGKSHIILGVKMTSSPSCRLDKPMGAYVNKLGLGAKKAKVVAEYDIDGEPLEVTRTITLKKLPDSDEEIRTFLKGGGIPEASGSWSVKYKGDTIRSSSDVAELLTSLFGVNNAIQEDAVFVMQNKAGEIIESTPATRSKAFQFLSGAEICQKAAEVAQRKLSNLHVVDRSEELEEKEEKLENLISRVEGLVKDVEDARAAFLDEYDVSECRRKLDRSDDAKRKMADYASTKKRLDDLKGAREEQVSKYAAGEQELEDLRKRLEETEDTANRAKQFIAAHATNATLAAQHAALLKEIDELEKEPLDRTPPERPYAARSEIGSMEKTLADMRMSLSNADKFLRAFGEDGTCPTCGSAPANVDSLIEREKAIKNTYEPKVAEVTSLLAELKAAWAKYDTDLTKYEQWQLNWESRVTSAASRLESFGQVPDVDDNKLAEAKKVVQTYQDLESAVRGKVRDVQALKDKVAALDVDIATSAVHVKEMSTAAGLVLADEEIERLKAVIEDDKQRRDEYSNKKGSLDAYEEQMVELDREVQDLKVSQGKIANKLKAQEFLEGIKSIMHHSAIPHDRSIVYIDSINRLINNYCVVLHAPFGLFVDPATQQFLGHMNGATSPAFQFSGGQKTLAAWAWHLSLYEKHGSQVGFLMMDEPTVGLDEANLANVGEAVRHLTRYCHGSGMQFIMVTHEESLASVFDKTLGIH